MKAFRVRPNRLLLLPLIIGFWLIVGFSLERTGEIPSGFSKTPMHAWDPHLFREGSIEHLFFGGIFWEDEKGRLSYSRDPRDKTPIKRLIFAIG